MLKKAPKFIFVMGGVLSGLRKGITTASIGLLLKNAGYTVTAVKIDPYISIDAGTMRPQEHGEVFITKDGGEIDQDLGNYERFLNEEFTKDHNITTGKVYAQVIENERKFVYQGRDAEIVPDVIDEIKRRILLVSENKDFILVEIGGTVGDIENIPFLIAAREMERDYDCAYLMLVYLPFLHTVGELKTKPAQHAVTQLRKEGINPDFIITRGVMPIDTPRLETLARRCFIEESNIIDIPDVKDIYSIPQILSQQGLDQKILSHFKLDLKVKSNDILNKWNNFVEHPNKTDLKKANIYIIGKYVKNGNNAHNDTYVSVLEALKHASFPNNIALNIKMIAADDLNPTNYEAILKEANGILVPQGWGKRGMEGKLLAIQYARENKIPYLGLCYGMQMASIEFARNVLGLENANSEEVDPNTPFPIVHLMEEQKANMKASLFGSTIRLGEWPCKLDESTRSYQTYQKYKSDLNNNIVYERHRHRYEFNNDFREVFEKAGFKISGTSPDNMLVEMVELPDHPFFIATQAHPEYKSRPLSPHPLFLEFIFQSSKGVLE